MDHNYPCLLRGSCKLLQAATAPQSIPGSLAQHISVMPRTRHLPHSCKKLPAFHAADSYVVHTRAPVSFILLLKVNLFVQSNSPALPSISFTILHNLPIRTAPHLIVFTYKIGMIIPNLTWRVIMKVNEMLPGNL